MAKLKYWMKRRHQCVVVSLLFIGVVVFMSSVYHIEPNEEPNGTIILVYKHRISELEAQLDYAFRQMPTTTTPKPCHDAFQETFDREKRFICTNTAGGVGNFMFAFASVYGMASMSNKTVLIQKKNPLIKYFRVKAQVVDDICVCKKAKFVYEQKHCAFNKDLLNLTEHRNYRPGYYFQSWKYFQHVADDIRQQFTFRDDLKKEAMNLIKVKMDAHMKQSAGSIGSHDNALSQTIVTVGIHVRRGDILTNPHSVEFGYMVAPAQYFEKAMVYFRRKFKTTVFLVCSDDMKWCKENIAGSDVMYMEGNPLEVDLAILSHCNHSIMSVGTFGWWGAYLASGETIYYKHPARNGSKFRSQFTDFAEFYYPDWIGMD